MPPRKKKKTKRKENKKIWLWVVIPNVSVAGWTRKSRFWLFCLQFEKGRIDYGGYRPLDRPLMRASPTSPRWSPPSMATAENLCAMWDFFFERLQIIADGVHYVSQTIGNEQTHTVSNALECWIKEEKKHLWCGRFARLTKETCQNDLPVFSNCYAGYSSDIIDISQLWGRDRWCATDE